MLKLSRRIRCTCFEIFVKVEVVEKKFKHPSLQCLVVDDLGTHGLMSIEAADHRNCEAPCQCLLVIKERRAGHSQRPDWVLNKPVLDCSAGRPVLTGLALRRPSKRSHGRPCA